MTTPYGAYSMQVILCALAEQLQQPLLNSSGQVVRTEKPSYNRKSFREILHYGITKHLSNKFQFGALERK
jgi:hypothetical protein